MGKKIVLGINELACICVLVLLKELGLEPPKPMPKENKAKLDELVAISKEYGSVGSLAPSPEYFGFLFHVETHREKSKEFFHKLEEKGYNPKVANRACIIDKRYMEGQRFDGFMVDIPPQYIDDEIVNFFKKYADDEDIKLKQDVLKGLLIYECELYPGKVIHIMYNRFFFGGGLTFRNAIATQFPQRDYKRVLRDIERDVDEWYDDHPGLRGN